MANDITVAWAMPVNAAYLGARMESHVESKATVTIFRLCVQHARIGSSLGKLTHELVEMIATRVRDAHFRKRLRKWQNSIDCCAGYCLPSDHFSQQQLQRMMGDHVFKDDDDDDDDDDDYVFKDSDDDDIIEDVDDMEDMIETVALGYERHRDAIEKFLHKVEDNSYVERTQTFNKCRKIFMQDFGLEAYFSAFRKYDERNWTRAIPNTTICAYLILPSMQSYLKTSSGPLVISYMSSMIIDPSILQEPSPERKARFRTAMRTLQLEPRLLEAQLTNTDPNSGGRPKAADRTIPAILSEIAVLEEALEWEWPKLMVLGSGTCYAESEREY